MKETSIEKTTVIRYEFENLTEIVNFLDKNYVNSLIKDGGKGETTVENQGWTMVFRQRFDGERKRYVPFASPIGKSIQLVNGTLTGAVSLEKYFDENGIPRNDAFAKDFRISDFVGTLTVVKKQ